MTEYVPPVPSVRTVRAGLQTQIGLLADVITRDYHPDVAELCFVFRDLVIARADLDRWLAEAEPKGD